LDIPNTGVKKRERKKVQIHGFQRQQCLSAGKLVDSFDAKDVIFAFVRVAPSHAALHHQQRNYGFVGVFIFATWIIGHTIKTLSFFKLFLSTNCYILLPT